MRRAPRREQGWGAKRVEVDGIWFDSKAEVARYQELRLLQAAGEIEGLEVHPKPGYKFVVNGKWVGSYTCDFRYREVATGEVTVEDVKNKQNAKEPDFRLRVRLMRACFGIDVMVVVK